VVRIVEKIDDASPDSRVESVRADDNLDAITTPLLKREIAATLSRGAPVARPLAVTRRLPVDVQTIATVPAEDESAAEQVFLGVYTAAR